MTTEIFKKNTQGGFESIGETFTGFPANGIWIVQDGRKNCIYPFMDVSEKPSPTLISYMQFTEELSNLISKQWTKKGSLSVNEISSIACEFFAIKAGGIKIDNSIVEN